MKWLTELCRDIRSIDPVRPITMDIFWVKEGRNRLAYYSKYLPVDKYMLVADTSNPQLLKEPVPPSASCGSVPVHLWHLLPAKQTMVLPGWQDLENRDFVAFQGILDLQGRRKPGYDSVAYYRANKNVKRPTLPDIKILKPAKIAYANSSLNYEALLRDDSGAWQFFHSAVHSPIQFEWYLVRTDYYGTTLYMKKMGEGPAVSLNIPKDPQYYRLYLEAVLGNQVKEAGSTLNIPLE